MPWGGSTDGGNGDDDETNIVEETVRVSCLTEGTYVSLSLVWVERAQSFSIATFGAILALFHVVSFPRPQNCNPRYPKNQVFRCSTEISASAETLRRQGCHRAIFAG